MFRRSHLCSPGCLTALLLAALTSGCIRSDLRPEGQLHLRLRFAPTDDKILAAAALDAIGKQSLRVGSFSDIRAEPAVLGANSEAQIGGARKGVWTVSTDEDVPRFLAQSLEDVLRANGVTLDKPAAGPVIKAEVRRYFVAEGETYNADALILFILEDGGGHVLGSLLAEGHAKRWGRSFSEENYQEALGNAYLEAVKSFFASREVQAAMRGAAAP